MENTMTRAELDAMLNDYEQKIVKHIADHGANLEKSLQDRMVAGINAMSELQKEDKNNQEEQRKYWIRTFASQLVASDTINGAVEDAFVLWEKLESRLNETVH